MCSKCCWALMTSFQGNKLTHSTHSLTSPTHHRGSSHIYMRIYDILRPYPLVHRHIITHHCIVTRHCIVTALSHSLHVSHSHILTYSDRPGYLKLPLSYIEPISSLVWHCFAPSSSLPSSLPSSLLNNLRTASECHVDTSIMYIKST